MKQARWTTVAAAFALLASVSQAAAQPVADFYRGKQIRMISAFAAGTDYDI